MDIMVYTRTPREEHDGIHYVSLDTLLKNSGYISLHCPLTNYMFVVCLFYIFCFIGNYSSIRFSSSGFRLWYWLDICEYLSNICV